MSQTDWKPLTRREMAARAAAAGFAVTTTLEIKDGTPGQPADLWSVMKEIA